MFIQNILRFNEKEPLFKENKEVFTTTHAKHGQYLQQRFIKLPIPLSNIFMQKICNSFSILVALG